MNAKNYLFALLFTCFFSGIASAQEEVIPVADPNSSVIAPDPDEKLVSHTVAVGETVMLIAKKYKVKPTDIYEYNPDAIQGVSQNVVLQIPVHRDYKHKKAKLAGANALTDSGEKSN